MTEARILFQPEGAADWKPHKTVQFPGQQHSCVLVIGENTELFLTHRCRPHLLDISAKRIAAKTAVVLRPCGGLSEKGEAQTYDHTVPGKGTYRIYHASRKGRLRW